MSKHSQLGYCYDGSSDWSIGPKEDPQVNPLCHVWDRNDDRAKAKCELIVNAVNTYTRQREVIDALTKELEAILDHPEALGFDGIKKCCLKALAWTSQ